MEPEKSHPLTQKLSEDSKQIIDKLPKDIKQFYYFHGVQLFGSMFPMNLITHLYDKISKCLYDAGQYLQIVDNEDSDTFQVKAIRDIPANSNVFVIDHAMTFRYPDFRRLLMENSSLIPRLKEILKYQKGLKKLPNQQQIQDKPIGVAGNFTQIEFDSMDLTELSHLQFPNNTITLSLVGNQLTDEDELIKKMQYLQLKAFWLNNNPIEQGQKIVEFVHNSTHIQMFNSKFTKHCSVWGLKYCQKMSLNYAFNQNENFVYRLNLDGRNVFAIDVSLLQKFPKLALLSLKDHQITTQEQKLKIIHILQNNKSLKYLYVDYEAETALYDLFIEKKISEEVFKRILVNGHSFFCKETTLMETEIDQIHQCVFKLAGSYRLASSEKLDESSIWYMNDELGSAIQHDDHPNIKIIPFLFAQDNKQGPNMVALSLIWPIRDIKAGECLVRDYLNGLSEERQRSSRLAIWYDLPINFFSNRIQEFQRKMDQLQHEAPKKIAHVYNQNTQKQRGLIKKLSDSGELYPDQLTLITDHETVLDHMNHKQIKVVKTLEEAQIVFLTTALDEEKWNDIISKELYINQFPYESSVVMKHNLADTVQSTLGNNNFLMRTYNLENQLPEFIGDFKKRERQGEDNLWILKPPNMARSLDMIITDNLSLIIKCMETGPKIAQKYIERPVLRKGNKVDLRYILLVKSMNPLTMYLYKHFWIRSSNNKYNVDRRYLSTYETQFTVMNYGTVSDFKQIPYKQFIEDFEKDYAPNKWSEIDEKIKKMLRNTFIAASLKYPQMHYEKSRALYGIDIMIDEATMQPKLLEITFSPDCNRACDYYPTFYNQVFQTLFLNIAGQNMIRII